MTSTKLSHWNKLYICLSNRRMQNKNIKLAGDINNIFINYNCDFSMTIHGIIIASFEKIYQLISYYLFLLLQYINIIIIIKI